MTLQFDPGAYFQAFQTGQQNRIANQNRTSDALQNLGQGLLQYKQQQRQNAMQDLQNQLTQQQIARGNIQMNPLVPPASTTPSSTTPNYSNGVDMSSLMPNIGPNGNSSNTPMGAGEASLGSSPSMGGGSSIVAAHNQFLKSKGFPGVSKPGPSPMFSNPTQGNSASTTDPEAPYLKILQDPTESPIRQQMASDALKRITEEEQTPYEKAGWQANLAKAQAEPGLMSAQANEANAKAKESTAQANLLTSPGGGYKVQNQLEQQGRDLATKIINSRSGEFGIQNGKVDQAIHLRSLLDQYKQVDPRTGQVTYNVPNANYTELAVGLANLLSNGGQATESTINNIRQNTAQGDLNKMLTYAGFDPQALGGSTQSVLKNLSDSIDRQGIIAEQLREPVLNQIRQQMPTMLNPDTKERIINSLGVNSYRQYQKTGGQQTWGGIGASPTGSNPNGNASVDSQAVQWARQNLNDPRARKILALNGVQ